MKRKVLRVVLCFLALFALINISWYVWRMVKYGSYSTSMEKSVFSTWLMPHYVQTDAERYDYGIKYPDYLTLTGNLSVGCPMIGDTFSDGLIIWPKPFGGYEYGVLLYDNEGAWQIYINADGSAVNPEDNDVVARHQENIDAMLRRAQKMWDLE